MSELLLWCAGAKPELLTPEDRTRQEQLGAHVLFTALLAFASSCVALNYVFSDGVGVFVFALLWSISIFLLDRTLVISPVLYYKHQFSPADTADPGKSSETEDLSKISKSIGVNYTSFFLRLLIALVLGIFIATPFELHLFQAEIESELLSVENAKEQASTELGIKQTESDIQDKKNKQPSTHNETLKKTLEDGLKALKDERDNLITKREREASGEGGSKTKGYGKFYDRMSNDIDDKNKLIQDKQKELEELAEKEHTQDLENQKTLAAELSALEKKLAESKDKLGRLRNDAPKLVGQKTATNSSVSSVSLLTRIQTLTVLQDKDVNIRDICRFVLVLFVIFEIIPLIAKLLFAKTPYDYKILENRYDAEVAIYKKFIHGAADLAKTQQQAPGVAEEKIKAALAILAETHKQEQARAEAETAKVKAETAMVTVESENWIPIFKDWKVTDEAIRSAAFEHLDRRFLRNIPEFVNQEAAPRQGTAHPTAAQQATVSTTQPAKPSFFKRLLDGGKKFFSDQISEKISDQIMEHWVSLSLVSLAAFGVPQLKPYVGSFQIEFVGLALPLLTMAWFLNYPKKTA